MKGQLQLPTKNLGARAEVAREEQQVPHPRFARVRNDKFFSAFRVRVILGLPRETTRSALRFLGFALQGAL
jgi:hypothetical protein